MIIHTVVSSYIYMYNCMYSDNTVFVIPIKCDNVIMSWYNASDKERQ